MPVIQLRLNREQSEPVNIHILHSFVPKTGGTAILNYFKKNGAMVYFDSINNALSFPKVGVLKCPTQHFHYELLDSMFNIDKFISSFSIVRNPIDRIRSDYVWSQRGVIAGGSPVSFDDWVDYVFAKYQSNPFILDNHIRPQSEFIGPKIKTIYKYEEGLNTVVESIFKDLKIQTIKPVEIERLNTSEEYLSNGLKASDIEIKSATKDKIMKFYEADFKTFDYAS